jgi:DNA-binding transcriptional LysR family regulator
MNMKPDQWLGIEVRHLAALGAVAEQGSFRRAAARLGYSQAAVSAQIAALERLLGTRLLDRPRGRGGVTLTSAGRVALAHSEAIVARLTAAQAEIVAAGTAGPLRIGVFQTIGARLLPELVIRLRRQRNAFGLDVVERASDGELLELIALGDLDLGFSMLPLPDGPFQSAEIMREPFVLLTPIASPLAARRSISLDELRGVPLVAGRNCRATATAEHAARAAAGQLQITFRSDDNETIRAHVAAGLGVSLVPRLLVDERDERLVAVAVDDDIPPRRIGLAWHAERSESATLQIVIDLSRQIARELTLDAGDSPSNASPAAAVTD